VQAAPRHVKRGPRVALTVDVASRYRDPAAPPVGVPQSVVSALLDGASADEIESVGRIVRSCPTLVLAAGETCSGSMVDAALVVVEAGLVLVRASAVGRRDVVVADASRGAFVVEPGRGELQALTQARLLFVDAVRRDELLAVPAAAALIADGLATALAHSLDVASVMASSTARARIELKLLQLARAYGRVMRDGVRLDFPLTHELLGDMTGTARETVTRVLDLLEREGFLGREGRTYRLLIAPDLIG
jgi:CRP-like cAMP-binding protein